MRLSHFDYYAPATLIEAIDLLQSKGPGVRVMAGGTDLLIKMRHAGLKPKAIISLKSIKGLNTIAFDEKKGLTIGATALLADVARHPDILKHYPTVAQAARGTANAQVRNMGTVIGNLCNASPSADNAPTLLAMGAEVHIQGPTGTRTLPLEQFFRGPGATALEPFEIVTAIHTPLPAPHSGTAYISLSARGKLDCTAVGAGIMLTLKGRVCEDLRLFIGACGPTPVRARRAEAMIRGKELTDDVIDKAGVQASEETRPITDVRASADYRSKMVAVLTRRVLRISHKSALER
ncbi:MAG: xanthine dehydrogenase family protein subunit M [Deltaproteobacteria bacterium]|nr:xanthine dehydrogenase family protein subunit M [Deltaproteobacteria bacterium]